MKGREKGVVIAGSTWTTKGTNLSVETCAATSEDRVSLSYFRGRGKRPNKNIRRKRPLLQYKTKKKIFTVLRSKAFSEVIQPGRGRE